LLDLKTISSEPIEKESSEIPISTTAETPSSRMIESQEVILFKSMSLINLSLFWFCTSLTNYYIFNLLQVSKEATIEETRIVSSPTVDVPEQEVSLFFNTSIGFNPYILLTKFGLFNR